MEVPLLVDDFLRRAAHLYPEKPAVIDGPLRLSYREIQDRVHRLSNALLRRGIAAGDRVAILSPNSHFFFESFYATSQIGAVLVPLNFRLQAAELQFILDHSGARCLLADDAYAKVADEIRPRLPKIETWICAAETASARDGWLDWNALLESADAGAPPPSGCTETDLVSINYTSGTTASPKGVRLTHRNCYLNAYNMIAHLGLRHEDVELWTLPMFHCNGWGGVYALTGMGGTHVILREVDGRQIYQLMQDERVTFACMAPAVLRTILDFPDRDDFAISWRPRFTVAGAPPPAAFIERLETELGFEFIQIYGLTETAPLLTVSRPDANSAADDWGRRARAGVAGLGVEIVLLDDDDQPVPKDGEAIGEICARSNVVFDGYWEQPDQTDEAIRDGWFHTGDLAVWDRHENIHIVDRKKDVIISGGENISSSEIEDVLYQHPAVLECAVIGVPSQKWGETPKALIVGRSDAGEVSEREIIDFCRERLSHFKCPTSVDFVRELPRTATGKLQKFRLREGYWKGKSRMIG